MLNAKSIRKVLCVILLATFALSLVATSPVLAYLYRAAFTVSNNGSTDYTALPVSCSVDVDWLIDNGFITTATALDTRIETLGGMEQLHMMVDDRIMAFVPSLDGDSQLNWYLTTGNAVLDSFPVITGNGGSIIVTDHADLELANNFSVEFEGWLDTSYSCDYPSVVFNISSKEDVGVYTHNVTLPSGIEVGDLLLVFFSSYSGGVVTWPSGWTVLDEDANQGVIYKVADGTESSPMLITTADSEESSHQALVIRGYIGIPEISTYTASISNTPDPPSLTTTWEGHSSTLWIAAFTSSYSLGGRTITGWPSGYSHGEYTEGGSGDFAQTAWAWKQELTSPENPSTFTLSNDVNYDAYTIGIRAIYNSMVIRKASAFEIENTAENELSAKILGGTPKTLTVEDLTSGEYLVEVWADGTNFGVDIDGVTENSTALGGASVPDNSNNWGISMPYFNCYNHTVGVNHRIRYEPDAMIEGTILPNEENPGTHDGTISWGSNPSGVSVTLGSLTAPESTVTTEGDEGGYQEAMHKVGVTDWFLEPDVGTKLAVHPLRPLVTIWSDNSTVTEVQAWRFLGLAMLLLITVWAAIAVRGHLLIAGLACGGTIALLVQQTVWPGWTLVFIIPAIIAGVMAERTPSIG